MTAKQEYNCIPCKVTFSLWRAFKRHNEEKHGDSAFHHCPYCQYRPKRQHDLKKHNERKHKRSVNITSSLINDVIAGIVNDDSCIEEEYEIPTPELPLSVTEHGAIQVAINDLCVVDDSNGTLLVENEQVAQKALSSGFSLDTVSEYERIRLQTIAERDALFKQMYPDFETELRAFKVTKVVKRKPRRTAEPRLPSRKSSRIKNQYLSLNLDAQENEPEYQDNDLLEDSSEVVQFESDDNDNRDTLDIEEMADDVNENANVDEELGVSAEVGSSIDGDFEADVDECPYHMGRFACEPCGKSFR